MSDATAPLSTASPEPSRGQAVRPLRTPEEGRISPYLSFLSVDGFGALAGLELESLSPTLNVVLGPNEAGKSTLFDFITGVLFGFPRQRADEHFRLPVNGGRHGGRLGVVGPDGGTVVVERHGAPQKLLTVTRADGTAADESELVRLLGGATRDVFSTVFAVDLDDLRRLDGLASEQVREVLFSSSVVGQRRSAAKALQELDARCEALVRPRQGGRANELATQLRAARRELALRQAEAEGYGLVQSDADRKAAELDQLRSALAQRRAEARDLELLQRCWAAVVAHRQSSDELALLSPLSDEERRVLELEPQIRALRVEFSGHTERLQQLAESRSRRLALTESIDERVARLGDFALAAATEPALPLASVREELAHRGAELARARAELDSAGSVVARAQAELALSRGTREHDENLPAAAEIERRLSALRELRGLVTSRDSLEREVERDLDRARLVEQGGSSQPSTPTLAVAVAAIAAVLLVAVAALLVAEHHAGLGTLVGLTGAGCAVLTVIGAIAGRRSKGRDHPGRPGTGADGPGTTDAGFSPAAERLERLRATTARVAALSTACGVAEPVEAVSVQRAMDDEELQLARRKLIDEETRLESDRAARLASAQADELSARQAVAEATVGLHALAEAAGLPLSDDPVQLTRLVDELIALRERCEAVGRIDADAKGSELAVAGFDARLGALIEALPLPVQRTSGAPVGSAPAEPLTAESVDACLQDLENRLAQVSARHEQREALALEVRSTEQEIERALGHGPEAETLRRELASGHVLEWASRAAAVEREVADLEASYAATLREHEGLVRQLSELLASDEIAVLEARCEALEADLDTALRGFLVASGARLLLHRTLRRYEQERQPAVLERASEHFSQVTSNRYRRVVVDSAPDGTSPTVQVVPENGSPVDATALSRGTIEQLYLCLRLALAESFAARYVALPIVLDDVLVNFDPARTAATAAAIAEASARHQVIAFTCHPHLAELLASTVEGSRLVELEG